MSNGKFDQVIKNINYFQKRFDTNTVIGYIENEFQNLYKNEPNNYASFIRKERARELGVLNITNLDTARSTNSKLLTVFDRIVTNIDMMIL